VKIQIKKYTKDKTVIEMFFAYKMRSFSNSNRDEVQNTTNEIDISSWTIKEGKSSITKQYSSPSSYYNAWTAWYSYSNQKERKGTL
jgi:hypothetical protein